MGFGLFSFVKQYLKLALFPCIYAVGIGTTFITMFKEAKWGFFLLVAMIPQPNIWYKLHDYPLGKDFLDLLFFSVLIGMFIQKKGFIQKGNSILIIIVIVFSYFTLWNSSIRFSLPLPISPSNHLLFEYKNYAQMLFLYFFALNIIKEEDQQKILIVIMAVVILFIAIRVFRNFYGGISFRWEKRVTGPFGTVGLGPNEFAGFITYNMFMFLALFLYESDKKRKLLFLTTTAFCLYSFFFSFSRAAYVAGFATLLFYGVLKKRSLLIFAICILIFWKALLPVSVIDRIDMTMNEEGQVEHSAAGRPELWKIAFKIFLKNPLIGVGYDGYTLSVGGKYSYAFGRQFKARQDVHSIFMRILCEQGVIGFFLFLLILFRSFASGFTLFKYSQQPFYQGLGFGFMGCVISLAITNLFGDRWSYFVLGSYFWIFWGIVDRSIINLGVENIKKK